MTDGLPSDEQLMAAYINGDGEAFSALFSRYQPLLIHWLSRRMRRADDAQDVVQQAFLHVHRARRQFQQGRRLRPWLYTIAKNLSRDHARRCHNWREVMSDVEPADDQRDPAEALGDRTRVRRALASLPPIHQQVLALQWLEGMSYEEIAAEVGASYDAVKLRAFRARAALRVVLEQSGVADDEPARAA